MSTWEIILIAIGLAMDAFAVAICKGLTINKLTFKPLIIVGGYFGIFQALMPLIGYLLGSTFADYITEIDHWIAFALLAIIGASMIIESFKDKDKEVNPSFSFKVMVLLAIATSIDALAIGVSFSFLSVNIYVAITIIGIITLVLSIIGVIIGYFFGNKFKRISEISGGIILILLGIKILIEHLFFN